MDKVEDIVGRLRAIAVTKEGVDFAHGRKAPLYGRGIEIEWEAAELIQSQQALIEEMREALTAAKSQLIALGGYDDSEFGDAIQRTVIDVVSKALSQKDQIDG